MSIGMDSDSWIGCTLTDREHRRLGRIEEIYLDEDGRPQWMLVRSGRFAVRHTFIPLAGAAPRGGGLMTPYDKRHIEAAPQVDPGDDVPDEQVRALYDHYGLQWDRAAARVAARVAAPRLSTVERVLLYVP